MIDTGNFLKDPITGESVIIVDRKNLEPLFWEGELEEISKVILGKSVLHERYLSRIKILPFSSLGKENGMLVGFKMDCLQFNTEEEAGEMKSPVIGIYEGVLSKVRKIPGATGVRSFK